VQAIPLPPPLPIPNSFVIPTPTLGVPTIKPLEWEPIPVRLEDVPIDIPNPNPANPEESAEEKEEEESEEKESKSDSDAEADAIPELQEVQTVTIPFVGIEVPLPRTEILVIASTTAGVSSVTAVAGTLIATTLFRKLVPLLKPIFKTIAKKLAKARKKKPPLTFGRQKLLERRPYTSRRKVNQGRS
jgi:hypothetical protein